MDDRPDVKKQISIQQQLNRWVIIVSGCFSLLAGIVSGIIAFVEAQESQDIYLHQVGILLEQTHILNNKTLGDDSDEKLIIQSLQADNKGELPVPLDSPDGIHTLTVHGTQWRILVLTIKDSPSPPSRFAIGQQTEFRNELARDSGLRSFVAVLLLAPLLIGLVHLVIRNSFKPLRALSPQIDQLAESGITPLDAQNIPLEITPFIDSINHLLIRINHVFSQQQSFVSDAAHELRTPLTALSLLTENLVKAKDISQVKQRLIPLQQGMRRMQILVTQLLSLARMQGKPQGTLQPVYIQQIAQETIAELYPLAEAKSIDLGMIKQVDIQLLDSDGGLSMLLRNAILNAINYSPEEGRVDVCLSVKAGQCLLQVQDSGPGIPENELEKIFIPFYRAINNRTPGNGLGLAICLEVARRLGGKIHIQNTEQGGLLFTYQQAIFNVSYKKNEKKSSC